MSDECICRDCGQPWDNNHECLAAGNTKAAEIVVDSITDYLSKGGLFNPELMEHQKVSDRLMKSQIVIIQLRQQLAALEEDREKREQELVNHIAELKTKLTAALAELSNFKILHAKALESLAEALAEVELLKLDKENDSRGVQSLTAEVERLKQEQTAIRHGFKIEFDTTIADDEDVIDLVEKFVEHHKEKEQRLTQALAAIKVKDEALKWIEDWFRINIDGKVHCPCCYASSNEETTKWIALKHFPKCVIEVALSQTTPEES